MESRAEASIGTPGALSPQRIGRILRPGLAILWLIAGSFWNSLRVSDFVRPRPPDLPQTVPYQ